MKRVREEPPYQQPQQQRRPAPVGQNAAFQQRPVMNQQPMAGQGGQQSSTKLTTNDALSYLREVKNRFSDQKEVYDTFLEIMKEFKAQRIDTQGVIHRVKNLFRGHKELILGFNTFLPKGYEIELARAVEEDEMEQQQQTVNQPNKQPVEFDQAINYVNKIKTRFANNEGVYKAFLEILNMYRKGMKTINNVYDLVAKLFASHQDLLDEFTYFLPDNTPPAGGAVRPGQPRPGQPRPGQPLPAGQNRPRPMGMGGPPSPMGAGDPRLAHKRKAMRRGDEEDGEETRVVRYNLTKELGFFEKVKSRVRNKDAYNDFIKCLNLYASDIITRQELHLLATDIIGRYPDLMNGLHDFMSKCDYMEVDEQRLKNLTIQNAQRARQREEQALRDKYLTKPLSEIVANDTERVTPSYVKMPAGYPRLVCSGRTALGMSVLNDSYVNVITGSEDYSFKLMRKNQYEEALFRCEDDRYEFEMAIERNNATLKRLRPIAGQLAAMSQEDKANFRLEDNALGPVHWRSIEKLYADQGPLLVDLMKKNPSVAVPVVLLRLEQKDAEWRKVREEMTKTWKRIYEANYHKSLDHRSFYFKQAEKKALLPKTLVADVREAADKRKQDERYLRSLSLAYRYEVANTPDLTYDFKDNRVLFQDVWNVLRVAITENLGSGTREQVSELYLQLVEPFFGLKVRQDELDALRAARADDGEGGADGAAAAGGVRSNGAGGRAGSAPPAKAGAGGRGRSREARSQTAGLGDGDGDTKSESSDQAEDGTKEDVDGNGNSEDRDVDEDTSADVAVVAKDDEQGVDSADAHGGRVFDSCRPLAPYTGGSSDASASSSQQPNLLFGNENIYIFFRYLRILYDRLASARRCALQKVTEPQRGGGMYEAGTPEVGAGSRVEEDAMRVHGEFMSMLLSVIRGQLEASVYEDQCRSLLGTGSYELFTLDKLTARLVKHMQLMLADEQTSRLWDLYRYERSRSVPVSTMVYHINCHTVLDDVCYKVGYSAADDVPQLSIQLVDPDKSDGGLVGMEGYLTDYIKSYVSTPTPSLAEGQQQLFLRRSLSAQQRSQPDEALVEALGCVHILNGLECKISCATSKVSYVLDTEDVLCRLLRMRRSETDTVKQQRCDRFARWLEEQSMRSKQEQEAILALQGSMSGMPQ